MTRLPSVPDILTRHATPEALERAIAAHDISTPGHKDRVAGLVHRLARRIGLGAATAGRLAGAARRHDVGKLVVPVGILTKPGRLDPEEMEIVRLHTTRGARLLTDAGSDAVEVRVALAHHERWDGKGYPYGHHGDDIPLPARMTAIADVYDALCADRPYAAGMARNRALAIMTTEMRGAFDPDLLTEFMDLVHLPAEETAAA